RSIPVVFSSCVQIVAVRWFGRQAPLRPAFLAEQLPIWQQEILPGDRWCRSESAATGSSQLYFARVETRHASSRDTALHGRRREAMSVPSQYDLIRRLSALGNFLRTGRGGPLDTK